ncbi:T-cell immunoreceptor with Ig and ITIM domains isoform X2 [Bubalus bubalis]|uniref:T-cell immunoreceptor with Ig and ITIM domains isoform X2 n=1 Tax=Bubalus bubalis TaxID=89462 RepID=UPI001E1B6E19|nr:T-cell immunoreceptor with Ig and ITIM domains isoform X2 [Bubalus bubalis]
MKDLGLWGACLANPKKEAGGAVTGRIVTMGNISAEEGGSVTLQCHLSSTTAKVTQVNWNLQDQVVAIHHDRLGWHIDPAFKERVVPDSNLGLTLRWLTSNDTGQYTCVYHTYPDGIYKGVLFLQVLRHSGMPGARWLRTLMLDDRITAERDLPTLAHIHITWELSNVAEYSAGFQIPLLGAVAAALVVICIAVIAVATLARKKSLRIRSAEGDLGRGPSEPEACRPRVVSSPGSCVQADAGLCGDQGSEDHAEAEPHEYFNVLSYRSLASFSFPTETG